jgi:hypothetical protein
MVLLKLKGIGFTYRHMRLLSPAIFGNIDAEKHDPKRGQTSTALVLCFSANFGDPH